MNRLPRLLFMTTALIPASMALAQTSTFLEIHKTVNGNWPAYDGVPFAIHVACHAMMPTIVQVPAGGSVLVPLDSDDAPPSVCTVFESIDGMPPPPDGHHWLVPPSQDVRPIGYETVRVDVINRIRSGSPGGPDSRIAIGKTVVGGPDDMAGTLFTVSMQCDGGAPVVMQVPANGIIEHVFPANTPLPTTCQITELPQGLPMAPVGYQWVDTPPPPVTVAPVEFETVTVPVVNRLQQIGLPATARAVPVNDPWALIVMILAMAGTGWIMAATRR